MNVQFLGEKEEFMLFLKHGDYEIDNKTKLEGLLAHVKETLSQVKGITYKNIYFVSGALAFAIAPAKQRICR